MIVESKQAICYISFLFFSLLCSYYVINMIKNLELHTLIVLIWLKIVFMLAQISVPEISIPTLKAAYINPCIITGCIFFLSPYLNVTRMFMSTVSFVTQLNWNFLPTECFPQTYNLNGFTSRLNRTLYLWIISNDLLYMLPIFVLFLLQ